MNNEKNNGKGIFYGVIGVATLIVAIIGATFAYFTASASNDNTIQGNAAQISFKLSVAKETTVDESKGGLIPMTDSMVKAAVTATTPCVDDLGNAVCQIYSVTVENTGTAIIFLDGYVNLTGGSTGTGTGGSKIDAASETNMRWAQVFTADGGTTWTVNGTPNLIPGQTANVSNPINPIDLTFGNGSVLAGDTTSGTDTTLDTTQDLANYQIQDANQLYSYISNNYMRTSGHATGTTFSRSDDKASSLVYSLRLAAKTDSTEANKKQTLYFVVWLTEDGNNQTLNETDAKDFFTGVVDFISGEGAEVSATFNGYTQNIS